MRTSARVKAGTKTDLKMKIWEKGAWEFLLLIGAFDILPANLLLLMLTNKKFQWELQQEQEFQIIQTTRLISKKHNLKVFLKSLANLLDLKLLKL